VKVLLAEDDPLVRARFARVAEAAGHQVVAVADAAAALEADLTGHPELVVLDLGLPGGGTLELCRSIRGNDGCHAFVLVVTPRDGNAELPAVLDAGADDYLSEPVDDAQLAARLTIAERRIGLEAARRRAEEALARARYFAGIGETTVALQHEINNPLAALLGHAALIEQDLIEPGEERELLAVIVEQAHRIAGVVKRLSALRHPQTVEYVEGAWMLDLSRAVDASSVGEPAAAESPLPPATP
jgi:DNA-binding response OmpR family regulator